jgi:hypothetical protein
VGVAVQIDHRGAGGPGVGSIPRASAQSNFVCRVAKHQGFVCLQKETIRLWTRSKKQVRSAVAIYVADADKPEVYR